MKLILCLLNLLITSSSLAAISEQDFHRILDKVEEQYAPVIAERGGKLVVRRAWANPLENASINKAKDRWSLKAFGGLARHPQMTPDAFALIMCHELGHYLGGAPIHRRSRDGSISAEGQADWFAVKSCLPKIFEDTDVQRLSLAGLEAAIFYAAVGGEATPSFETPDPTIVSKTKSEHSKSQCRLDTYFQASIGGSRPTCWFKP